MKRLIINFVQEFDARISWRTVAIIWAVALALLLVGKAWAEDDEHIWTEYRYDPPGERHWLVTSGVTKATKPSEPSCREQWNDWYKKKDAKCFPYTCVGTYSLQPNCTRPPAMWEFEFYQTRRDIKVFVNELLSVHPDWKLSHWQWVGIDQYYSVILKRSLDRWED